MRVLTLIAVIALLAPAADAQTTPTPDAAAALPCAWMDADNRGIGHGGARPRHLEAASSDVGGVMGRKPMDYGHGIARDTAAAQMLLTDEHVHPRVAQADLGHTVGPATAATGHGAYDCTIGGSSR